MIGVLSSAVHDSDAIFGSHAYDGKAVQKG